MASKKELQKFQKSEEYIDLIKKTKNRRIDLQEKILNLYKDGGDTYTLKYNIHNHYYELSNALRGALSEISSNEKGAEAFKKELITDISKYEEGLTDRVNGGYGVPYSSLQITEVDLMRSKMIGYKIIEELLNGMIISTEKPKEVNTEGAF